jgi:anti-sigma factor RsiW
MNLDCENLDAFLAGDMPSDAAGRFASHLEDCAACRDTVDQQRWIDGLLNSPVRLQLEAPSKTLLARSRGRINKSRHRLRLIAWGAAAAMVIVIVAVGWTALSSNRVAQHSMIVIEPAVDEPSANSSSISTRNSTEPSHSTYVGGRDVLVVPVETTHRNVTVVRIYPTFKPSYEAQASAEQPSASDITWPNELNGG